MSGIEIGGLVLAVFPLVIATLDQYTTGLEVLRIWETKHYEDEIRAIRLEIEVQSTIFRNTYLNLLRLFLDKKSLVKILMEPSGFEKHSALIAPHLKRHLGVQWQMYSRLMEKLRNLLTTLRLHVDRTRPTSAKDWKSKVSSATKPIRFSFTVKHRQGLLQKIKEANADFHRLVEQKDALKDLGGLLAHQTQLKSNRGRREETTTLLNLLKIHLKDCPQLHEHSLGLSLGFLKPYNNDGHSMKSDDEEEVLVETPVEIWIESRWQDPTQPGPALSERVVYSIQPCKHLNCTSGSLCPVSVPTNQTERRPRRYIAHRHGPKSKGLCPSLTASNERASPITNSQGAAASHHTFSMIRCGSRPGDISLHDVLHGGNKFRRFPGYFYERDRLLFASLIALSVVYLDRSPWLTLCPLPSSCFLRSKRTISPQLRGRTLT
ncbi:hypothetical protein BJY04DRAFT_199137 [Aspergillus karnatakaensis]|uniref:uncharacterized protein n=1 Tax=Aspergillus karnatakaensis TaxID=1810916 RepID=UPI003CCD25CC